jgi:hypothetical protein
VRKYLPATHLTRGKKAEFIRNSKKLNSHLCLWLMPVIVALQEAEIRRIMSQGQPGQIVPEILYQKQPTQKRCGGDQVVGCLSK